MAAVYIFVCGRGHNVFDSFLQGRRLHPPISYEEHDWNRFANIRGNHSFSGYPAFDLFSTHKNKLDVTSGFHPGRMRIYRVRGFIR
jgi:hypothetical protein